MHPVDVILVELELQNSLGYFGSETCGVRFQDTTKDGRAAFDGSSLSTHTCLHRHSLPSLCPFVAGQSKSSLALWLLRQHCLHLRQPEGHGHGLVEVARRAQLRARLRPLAEPGIERAQAAVAVRLERAHAEFLGHGEGLVVVGYGGLALRGI